MRILILSLPGIAPWGGSEELWAAAAREGIAAGHDITAVPREDPWGSDTRWRHLKDGGAKVVERAPSRYRGGRMITEIVPPSIIDSACTADVTLLNAGGALRQLLDPAVLSLVEHIPPGRLILSIRLVSERDFLSEREREGARTLVKRASCVIVAAQRNADSLERLLAMRLPNPTVIPSPVGHGLGDYIAWPSSSVARFACVGRLTPDQKGQDLLLEIMAQRQWTERSWHLTFYGRGRSLPYLKDLADLYGLNGRVTFAGQTHIMREVWESNHVLVVPSREEGLPIVIMEAMVSGRLCVVTDVGGNTRYVREGISGFVAPGAQLGPLSEALERTWERRADWRDMGMRSREFFHAERDPSPGRTLLSQLIEVANAARSSESRPADSH